MGEIIFSVVLPNREIREGPSTSPSGTSKHQDFNILQLDSECWQMSSTFNRLGSQSFRAGWLL